MQKTCSDDSTKYSNERIAADQLKEIEEDDSEDEADIRKIRENQYKETDVCTTNDADGDNEVEDKEKSFKRKQKKKKPDKRRNVTLV